MISFFWGENIQENCSYGRKDRIHLGYQVTGKQQHILILLDLNTICKSGKWQEMLKQLRSVALLLHFEVFKNIVLKPTLVSMVSDFIKGCLDWSKILGKKLQHFGFVQCKTSKVKCPSLRNTCLPRVSPPHPVVRACSMPKRNLWSNNIKN